MSCEFQVYSKVIQSCIYYIGHYIVGYYTILNTVCHARQEVSLTPEVRLLDHMVVLFLVFKGASILFFIMVVTIYTPTSSVRGFPFLHTLSSIYYLLTF